MDPEALFPTPPGNPDALDAAAGRLTSVAADLDRLGGAYRAEAAGMGSAWQSPAASQAAAGQVGKLAAQATGFGGRTRTAAQAVSTYAAALREAIDTVKRYQAKAVTANTEARQEANRYPNLSTDDKETIYRQHFDAALQGERVSYPWLRRDLDGRAHLCAKALEEAVPGFQPGMSPAAAAVAARAAVAADLPLTHTADLIAAGGGGPDGLEPPTDPKRRAAWWATLTGAEQDALVKGDPKKYGSMPGLPAAGRDKANRILLDQDIADLEAKERAGTLTEEEKKALAGARAVRKQLDEVIPGKVDPVTKQPLHGQLLIYDARAFGGEGRAAIVVGDLDTADNVAFAVPGLGSDVPSYMDNVTGNALNLYDESRRAAPGESTAVVAWMGYDAPGFGNVAADNAAENGAKLLAADVRSVQDSRAGNPPHLTVIGHSYGSTTVGIAASDEGMRPDDIVLIGSPGAGHANTAADLHIDPKHVYVGSNSSDFVTYRTRNVVGWDALGQDPAGDEFGAVRFQAEAPDRNETMPGFADHSKYYSAGSESLYNMANVVTGDYGAVTTAEHRDEWKGYLLDEDPEHDRTPTSRTH